ncbi:uncharacterized protein PpBr36_10153 [Pyricularia pennisetigena]|uniref:uncharacterized protein n=1 Tax=Pyricularia pennisetigena TaxID=1578925 RepID=UPI001151F3AE|nr:uncharacterized protein PpBr36_10153 [Pyricularia pennisetigena]TLS21584.1 hypothetical protein PpBr36_10153 [Pyricularia pennisetigena]
MESDTIDATISVRQLSEVVVSTLPNILPRVQKFWRVVSRSPPGTGDKKAPARESRLSQIGAVISLFAPTADTGRFINQDHEEGMQFILQASGQSSSDNLDPAMKNVLEATSDSSFGDFIVFIVGSEKSCWETVAGGYFPIPEKGLPHVLFQLQPTLRVFRSRMTGRPLTKLIIPEEGQGLECKEAASSRQCWVCDSAGALSTGIHVDPDTTATLILGEASYYMNTAASFLGNHGCGKQSWLYSKTQRWRFMWSPVRMRPVISRQNELMSS